MIDWGSANVLRMPRTGGRPNLDRVLVSFYLDRETKIAVDELADAAGRPLADFYRKYISAGVAEETKRAAPRRRRKSDA